MASWVSAQISYIILFIPNFSVKLYIHKPLIPKEEGRKKKARGLLGMVEENSNS